METAKLTPTKKPLPSQDSDLVMVVDRGTGKLQTVKDLGKIKMGDGKTVMDHFRTQEESNIALRERVKTLEDRLGKLEPLILKLAEVVPEIAKYVAERKDEL